MPNPSGRFWTHLGANYVVSVDHVSYAWAKDEAGQSFLVFAFTNAHTFQTAYSDSESRNAALALFAEFMGATFARVTPPPANAS